ncbi:hypothetical protein AB0Q95_07595 [Streptomyces sp. NPDC059900]|uniref:hypothetical protein n=1 Tax=Streptomyces sp. NPDC059900 TaxID=3155816 RepID=UPI00343CCBA9
MESNEGGSTRTTANAISLGVLFGLSAGIIFGLTVFDNFAVGLISGIGVGGVAGIAFASSRRRPGDAADER